ncbi:MAG: germination protein YpeB [Firmicutes bacterium]|nr:germination protein YpeB [Bacillota bacterium]
MTRNYKLLYYIVSLAFVITLIFAFSFYNEINSLEAEIENNYQNAFAEFVTANEDLAMQCMEIAVINSPAQSLGIISQIKNSAETAVEALNGLPFAQQYISEMENYYNQLGDYALSCHETLVSGEKLSDMQQRQISSFAEDMESVAVKLQELQTVAYSDEMTFLDMPDMGQYLDMEKLDQAEYSFASVFTELNHFFAEKDDLTYAGKFSSHMQNVSAKGLSGDIIQQENALEEISRFMQLLGREHSIDDIVLVGESNDEATMPAFFFAFAHDSGDTHISVSKQGGKILSYYYERIPIEQVISIDSARAKAEQLVQSCGYDAMEVLKQYKTENAVCFEFNFRDAADILYYPDKLLVKIALDNGDLLAFEAHEYYMYHIQRELAAPIVMREVAEAGLNRNLQVQESSMSLVPDGKGKEILCYEFRVKNGEDVYIMHINTENGAEQQILYQVEDEENFYTK